MSLSLDAYLGIQPEALEVQSRRMAVIADNLANVDTPNYKARDLDFRAALSAAMGGADAPVALQATQPDDIGSTTTGASSASLQYRVPLAPALDGNTVNSELEQAAFAESTVRYQAALTFITSKLSDLMTAITSS